ncbi:hypothetical protein DESUT3_33440 [Desulfuromonas versatilis]|uniref:OsmC family protein n=1 Tax=Desulfuromonas versatilis TaxID=2802975 RepID=A0ABN6E1T9_9BACT|nr:OsmC family protein [Desulfuromonas versatilis]BCR06275.1 hypothetical protein DESUT3_33440 [Desulfuromonas versatilis]
MSQEVKVVINQVSASASKGTARQHAVLCDRPEAKGGTDQGAMGGELFLLGLGGCFMSNLLAAVKTREEKVGELTVEVVATLADSPQRFTAIDLRVGGQYSDKDLLHKLVTIAERGCIVANSIRNSVKLSFSIV